MLILEYKILLLEVLSIYCYRIIEVVKYVP